jgi:hypothetical protein
MRILFALLLTGSLALAEIKLGQPLTLKETTAIDTIVAQPQEFVGKLVQVKGKVVDLCEVMGCWMNLTDPSSGKMIRIKVKDGEMIFPKEAVGKMAIAEGTLVKIELTKEQLIAQLKHEAEMNKKPFDPASITGGKTIYQIRGKGAVILD